MVFALGARIIQKKCNAVYLNYDVNIHFNSKILPRSFEEHIELSAFTVGSDHICVWNKSDINR